MMDYYTTNKERVSYARMLIHVNATMVLPEEIWVKSRIGGFRQRIEYEFYPKFCSICKILGHHAIECRHVDNAQPAATAKNEEKNDHEAPFLPGKRRRNRKRVNRPNPSNPKSIHNYKPTYNPAHNLSHLDPSTSIIRPNLSPPNFEHTSNPRPNCSIPPKTLSIPQPNTHNKFAALSIKEPTNPVDSPLPNCSDQDRSMESLQAIHGKQDASNIKKAWVPIYSGESSSSTSKNFKHRRTTSLEGKALTDENEMETLVDYGAWISRKIAEEGLTSSEYSS